VKATLELVRSAVLNIINASPIPEDPTHAEDTVRWLLKIYPEADENLKIAALGHDIDRGSPEMVQEDNFPDYDGFKKEHAIHSALVMRELLLSLDIDPADVLDITALILYHEVGGYERVDYLKWADSLSFFSNNLPLFRQRHTPEEIEARIAWGLNRLPKHLSEHLRGMV
jgi:hypothetical protein